MLYFSWAPFDFLKISPWLEVYVWWDLLGSGPWKTHARKTALALFIDQCSLLLSHQTLAMRRVHSAVSKITKGILLVIENRKKSSYFQPKLFSPRKYQGAMNKWQVLNVSLQVPARENLSCTMSAQKPSVPRTIERLRLLFREWAAVACCGSKEEGNFSLGKAMNVCVWLPLLTPPRSWKDVKVSGVFLRSASVTA